MPPGRIWTRIGMLLLGTGALLVAFVAFQLWGTKFYTDRQQSQLKQQLGTVIGHSTLPLSSLGKADPGAKEKSSGLPSVASSVAATTKEPATGAAIGLLAIPKIGLDDALVQGTNQAQLQGGPGHYSNTPLPGQAGNAAIAGHRTTFAAPFYNLNELSPGDPIFVLTSQGLFRYNVTSSQVVSPNDTAVLDSTSRTPTLTLTTCNPRYSAATRLVVVAALDTSVAKASPPPTTTTTTHSTHPTSSAKQADAPLAGEGGESGGVLPAALWGAGTLLGGILLWGISRRLPRLLRWASYVVGVPALLLCLFVCFQHVSLALPASF